MKEQNEEFSKQVKTKKITHSSMFPSYAMHLYMKGITSTPIIVLCSNFTDLYLRANL